MEAWAVTTIQMWSYTWKVQSRMWDRVLVEVPVKAYSDFLVKCTGVPRSVQVLRKMSKDWQTLFEKSLKVFTTSCRDN